MRKYTYWKKWAIGLLGLGVLVWITWFFGYTYVRLVTGPKDTVPPLSSSQEQTEIRMDLTRLEFWTCQIGVFNSEKNAEQERSRLEQLGWDAQIVSSNPWMVGVGFAHSQDELSVIRDLLKEGGIVSVLKNIKLPERAYIIRGTGAEQMAKTLEAVHGFLAAPLTTEEKALTQLEKELITSNPKGLGELQEAGLTVLKAERTLQPEAHKIIALKLFAEYQAALETLKK